MCKFFSLVSDGNGKIYYFDARLRVETRNRYDSPDSHTSIADYYGFKGAREDKLNKYEYNPLTKVFTIDQINTTDDSVIVKKKCLRLNFGKIVPELVIKPIFHPLDDIKRTPKVTDRDLVLLRQWAEVRDSVRDSIRASVRDSIRDSVWDSVWDSIRDSIWDSIRASIRNSMWAYISSFFALKKWKRIKHEPGENPFQPCITLWEKGLVPSFDGKTWRLHGGKNAKVLWEGKL